jgi:hypothetical protein
VRRLPLRQRELRLLCVALTRCRGVAGRAQRRVELRHVRALRTDVEAAEERIGTVRRHAVASVEGEDRLTGREVGAVVEVHAAHRRHLARAVHGAQLGTSDGSLHGDLVAQVARLCRRRDDQRLRVRVVAARGEGEDRATHDE